MVPWKPRLAPPDRYKLVRGQLLIHSDFPLSAHHRLIEELALRRTDLARHLDLPLSDESIEVYLFENAEAFNGFLSLRHPGLPARRAFFVETDSRLVVYAQWGDHIAEDLRHEVTHGYLHAIVPGIPLWLDEGLAEYYEVSRGSQGLNPQHLDWIGARLHEGRWRPDLWRLEQFGPAQDMTQEDYAEAWAWVHFLLQSRPEQRELLRRYLPDLRRVGRVEPLSTRLRQVVGDPEPVLVEHIRQCVSGTAGGHNL